MRLNIKFRENAKKINVNFGEVHNISDGGYERGYAEGETKGYKKGYTEGEVKGFEDGAKSEYDRFWDGYQQNGERTDYYQTFRLWTTEIFKPKYPIIAVGDAAYMFDGANIGETTDNGGTFDFVEKGIEMDLSGATSLTYAFRNCRGIKRLGVIDCSGCSNLNRVFYSCRVVTIDKFVVNENTTYSNTFDYTGKLENITIEGVIGKNGFNVSACVNLTHESLMSIINHLKDFSGTGETRTCTLGATNLAKLTDSEKAIATQKGWKLS